VFPYADEIGPAELGEHLAWCLVASSGPSRDHGGDRTHALARQFEEVGISVLGSSNSTIAVIVYGERGANDAANPNFSSDEEMVASPRRRRESTSAGESPPNSRSRSRSRSNSGQSRRRRRCRRTPPPAGDPPSDTSSTLTSTTSS
jgi:hypothetical protein